MSEANTDFEKRNIGKTTLADIVTKNIHTAAVFEKYNLDFCCGGNKTISAACTENNIKLENVIADLKKLNLTSTESVVRYNDWELDFLADYIVSNHHKYVRESIPVISGYAEKAASVHGDKHPELVSIAKIFSAVYKDLKQHMIKEEEILFPYIKQLVKVKADKAKDELPYFGNISNPIKMLEAEHQTVGDGMHRIRKQSSNYLVPEDGCNTYRALYKELKEFEEDLHKHIHIENNILFPKSSLLENEVRSIK